VVDSIHAEAQAMWDLRRLLAWIREHGGGPVGVFGLSLGGYTAALLSALEPLDLVIAGIPAVDFRRLALRHASPLDLRRADPSGPGYEATAEALRVISPLAIDSRVPLARRAIFAGIADRIVPPDHPRDLWLHWGRPRIVWYPGAHVTFRHHRAVGRLIEDTFRIAAWLPALPGL
jgi:hypothetical protein